MYLSASIVVSPMGCGHLGLECFERHRGASGNDLATEVDVLGKAWVGVTELVGDGAGGQAGVVEHRRRRLPDHVAADVAEAGACESGSQVGLRVGGIAPTAQGSREPPPFCARHICWRADTGSPVP